MDLLAFATGLLTLGLIYGLLAVGLNMQFGFAGVLNFGYVAFFAVGAFASAIVTLPPPGSEAYIAAAARHQVGFGQPVPVGMLAAAACGGLLALFIGASSARLGTHYLAIATFAMAEVVRMVLANETWLTRGEFGIAGVPQPGKGTLVDAAVYPHAYLVAVLAVVAVLVAAAWRLGELPFGRLLRAVRDDELAARLLGKRTGAARLKALVLGGVLGGVAGSLWTHALGVVHVGQFVPIVTFQIWLAMLLGGAGNHLGVLLGAFLLIAIREGTRFIGEVPGLAELAAASPNVVPSLRFVLIGLLLIAVVRFFPRGILPEPVRKAPPAAEAPGAVAAPLPGPAAPNGTDAAPMLEVAGVSKRFGGLTAVNGASFTLRRGSVTGLIGPNGAGKSTMLDLISGVGAIDGGSIRLDGRPLAGLAPQRRVAEHGLCRTFQNPRLFARMTVRENLMVAGSGRESEDLWPSLTRPGRRRAGERAAAARAEAVLGFLELAHLRDTPAGQLSGGQRKLLSLGGVLMLEPKLVLLDEPAAGVNRRLAGTIFERIAALNREGLTFLIVEHEMDLVMRYCDRVVVMHNGTVLAEGTPAEIRRDPAVIAAYLGGAGA